MEKKYLGLSGVKYLIEKICSLLNKKVNIFQGVENAERLLSIDSSGNVCISEYPTVPIISENDEGKILQIKDGILTFVELKSNTIYINNSNETPDNSFGEDGDLYLIL